MKGSTFIWEQICKELGGKEHVDAAMARGDVVKRKTPAGPRWEIINFSRTKFKGVDQNWTARGSCPDY